ncbi:MAG: sensory transduction histidine kinase [Bryobacterales bacterium]|nr:sensory transduction histidine kinase [Bryobacterales bacterium]
MIEFFEKLFSTDFAPHVYCLRLPGLIQLHVWSDILIAASYALIPLSLLRIVRRRRDLVFPWMFALFGLFILSCGLTHAVAAWTLWHPIYRFDGLVKAITALVSLPTAILLIAIVPRVLELPRAERWRAEILERKRAELQVRRLNSELETRIEERTGALTKAYELLAQSERRRLLAIEAAGVGTWFWNVETREISWDQSSTSILGLDSASAITLDEFLTAVHPEDRDRVETAINEAASGREFWNVEYRIIRPDGAERWVRGRGSSNLSGSDTQKDLQGTIIDITEQKRMELAIARLASIVESSDDSIVGIDLNGRVTSWNQSAARMFGYDTEEMTGKPLSILGAPQQPEQMADILSRIRNGERIAHFETARKRKNGDLIDISLTVSPIISDSGQIIGASQIARDITGRKAIDAALRNSEERFRMLAETVPDILFTADARGVITFLSARFFSEMGLPQTERDLHSTFMRSIHPDEAARVSRLWDACVRDKHVFHSEFRFKKPGGGYRWVVTRALAATDAKGATVQWIGASTDIDQLKRAERALVQSNGELRQFAYAAAHDLQEPLRNVVNAAGMLALRAGDRLDGVDREFLEFCIEGAGRMHGMIKDLLAFTTAVDTPPVRNSCTDVSEAMKDVEANLAFAIGESKASIQCEQLPCLAIERTHLVQLLQNLIGNAIKYRSPERSLMIRITAARELDSWRFEISDNGIGFSPEYKQRIFGVFKRLHQRREFPGSGMGLAICARIVAHYGGTIWAEGRPGEGATFGFVLPAAEKGDNSPSSKWLSGQPM